MNDTDIIAISGSTDKYNFHSHTQFCDGRVDMEVMTRAAIDAGMQHWGFSPHSPVPFESPCNMHAGDVETYLSEVERLKGIYGDRISLYASMEIDYLGDNWGAATPYFRNLPLDYRIGSVHFVPSDKGYVDVDGSFESFKVKMAEYFSNDIRHVVNLFYRQSMAMVEAGGFDIIGHLDKIGHNASLFRPGIEDEDWYCRLVNDLIDLVIEKDIIAEINTKTYVSAGRFFPSLRYWQRLADAGVKMVVNSDAHYPERVNLGRDAAFALLKTDNSL
ncbi:MAG: histidinol-phosphatase [Muribaculum sp.]|nr:histidinol-phosphatase [Muribaculum sp.]